MHYNARYYDPLVGRFISADTIVPDPSNPQALNRYSYVTNNPVRYTDPTGHCQSWDEEAGCIIHGNGWSYRYGVVVPQAADGSTPWRSPWRETPDSSRGMTMDEVLQIGNELFAEMVGAGGGLTDTVHFDSATGMYEWTIDLDSLPDALKKDPDFVLDFTAEWANRVGSKLEVGGHFLAFAVDAGEWKAGWDVAGFEGLVYEFSETSFSWGAGTAAASATARFTCNPGSNFWGCVAAPAVAGLAAGYLADNLVATLFSPPEGMG
ncbi:MAG: RHS repeat-associated core domain-containing protein [bacterium]|nr:RHS repeat-associated core domain-containing protein [bacterium]